MAVWPHWKNKNMKSKKELLMEELKDHFPNELYGMKMFFILDRLFSMPASVIPSETLTIDNKTTLFEFCRTNIVKDVITITDKTPDFVNYYFVIEQVNDAESSIKFCRVKSKDEL